MKWRFRFNSKKSKTVGGKSIQVLEYGLVEG